MIYIHIVMDSLIVHTTHNFDTFLDNQNRLDCTITLKQTLLNMEVNAGLPVFLPSDPALRVF
jgi:hypothetical protein